MKHVKAGIPSEMTTDEIVEVRGKLRKAIKMMENSGALTVQEESDLREARAYLRSLMKEAGKRFIQERLF